MGNHWEIGGKPWGNLPKRSIKKPSKNTCAQALARRSHEDRRCPILLRLGRSGQVVAHFHQTNRNSDLNRKDKGKGRNNLEQLRNSLVVSSHLSDISQLPFSNRLFHKKNSWCDIKVCFKQPSKSSGTAETQPLGVVVLTPGEGATPWPNPCSMVKHACIMPKLSTF